MTLARASAVLGMAALGVLGGCGSAEPSGQAAGGSAMVGNAGTAGAAQNGGSAGDAGTGGASAGTSGTGGTQAPSGGAGGASGGAASMMSSCVAPKTDDEQPMLLSQTGCVNMTDPTKPAAGLVPYAVRSALWSDGATKERFMRVPDGAKIHVLDCAVDADACKDPGLGGSGEDEGHFDMPVGTVLVKNFSIEGKHIETRLLMRRSSSALTGWKGFSYEWNDAQTDATLLPDNEMGKEKPVGSGSQVWHYPSRSQCLDCHTRYGGRSLGPSTQQLNSDFAYADGTMNQLEKLKALGLFDAPPKKLEGYPDPFGTDATLEQRARSYIQTNCAICHRPGGEFSSIDMRFTTPLADTKMCDAVERDTDKVPPYRITPGKPAESTMSTRMHALDMLRMPQIGSKVVDEQGTKLIDDWITAMPASACPAR
jgi:uncharacterized repeat protein (TIGR03806 family)